MLSLQTRAFCPGPRAGCGRCARVSRSWAAARLLSRAYGAYAMPRRRCVPQAEGAIVTDPSRREAVSEGPCCPGATFLPAAASFLPGMILRASLHAAAAHRGTFRRTVPCDACIVLLSTRSSTSPRHVYLSHPNYCPPTFDQPDGPPEPLPSTFRLVFRQWPTRWQTSHRPPPPHTAAGEEGARADARGVGHEAPPRRRGGLRGARGARAAAQLEHVRRRRLRLLGREHGARAERGVPLAGLSCPVPLRFSALLLARSSPLARLPGAEEIAPRSSTLPGSLLFPCSQLAASPFTGAEEPLGLDEDGKPTLTGAPIQLSSPKCPQNTAAASLLPRHTGAT